MQLDPTRRDSFTVAQARAAGWRRSQTSAPHLERPFHGVRTWAPLDAASLAREERHLARVMAFLETHDGDAFASHVSAAASWSTPLPAAMIDDEVDISVWSPARNLRAKGVRGHEVDRRLAHTVRHPDHGFVVTTPATTWAMLGAGLRHPYDLVAAADAMVRTPQHPSDPAALATIDQLAAAVAAGRRVGVVALRAALGLVRTGAASRPETWTRLTLLDAGLPEPVLAHPVFDASGDFIGRIDLAYPQWKIAIEYEGEQHLTDPRQWAADIRRYERLAAEGWLVIRVTKDELFHSRASLVARVRRAVARAQA